MFPLPHTLLALSFSILQGLGQASAYLVQDSEYENGVYGENPVQEYVSTSIVSPQLNLMQWDPACDDGYYTMFTPRGDAVKEPGAAILNSKGDLIWWKGGYNQVYNLQAQEWDGNQYLTFWAGDDTVGGHGAGLYYMLDSSYNEVRRFSAANGLDGDLHDFKFTDEGTALLTIYEKIHSDLTPLGKSPVGAIWDCVIQEIRLEDQSLVFQWRASDHYDLTDTYRDIGDDGSWMRAFDFFHINSVEKDIHGNYLTSSRYTHSITYINGKTGSIIWILGGKRNNFTDLSNGKATDFRYQHDARWQDHNIITLFDNGAEDGHPVNEYSRGMRLRLDFTAMTVELVTEYINPHEIFGVSQGNMHVMASGDVILGYGNSAAWTQFDSNGTVLCDVHFGPGTQFSWGKIQSYRVFKYEWHGYPTTIPDVRVIEDEGNRSSIYISWNGDTEVVKWGLQRWLEASDSWEEVAMVPKTGFETKVEVSSRVSEDDLRVFGVDAEGNEIGVNSKRIYYGPRNFWSFLEFWSDFTEQSPVLRILGVLTVSLVAISVCKQLLKWRARIVSRYQPIKPYGKEAGGEAHRLD